MTAILQFSIAAFRPDRRDASCQHTFQRHRALGSRADGSAGRKARLDRAFRRALASLTRRAAALADARKRKQQPSDFLGYLNRAGSQSLVELETAYRRNLH
jgi:hypothetical protein